MSVTFKKLPLFLLVLFLFSLGCKSDQSNFGSNPKEATPALNKIKAPDFTLTDLSGNTFSLSTLKGKVVFIDFWATWCPPCVISAPEVERMVQHFKREDVVFLSVSLDTDERTVRRFIQSHPTSGRMAMAGDSQIDLQYQVRSLPSFYLIDKQGYIASLWEGYAPSLPKIWRESINYLLKTKHLTSN